MITSLKKDLNAPLDDTASIIENGNCVQFHIGGTTAGWLANSYTSKDKMNSWFDGVDQDDPNMQKDKTCAELGYFVPAAAIPEHKHMVHYSAPLASVDKSSWSKPTLQNLALNDIVANFELKAIECAANRRNCLQELPARRVFYLI